MGTRLHAGIRCLNGGHRSLIIAIDNRARQIGEDTGLPVLEREDGYLHKLADWVNHPVKTEINLPWTSIDKWKKQFNQLYSLAIAFPISYRVVPLAFLRLSNPYLWLELDSSTYRRLIQIQSG